MASAKEEAKLRSEKVEAHTDHEFLRRESNLRGATIGVLNSLSDKNARRHLNEGFVRRFYMLQSSRLFLKDLTKRKRHERLSTYEATDCAIHVNAYYLNLRGSFDNLAWVLHYEWGLFRNVSEKTGRACQDCNLFGIKFIDAINSRATVLASEISKHRSWATELASIRDPAAHRIPIYVPPGVITSQAQIEEFRRIETQVNRPEAEREGKSISCIMQEAQAVSDFAPLMVMSTTEGLKSYRIAEQITKDHDTYLKIATLVVSSLCIP